MTIEPLGRRQVKESGRTLAIQLLYMDSVKLPFDVGGRDHNRTMRVLTDDCVSLK